MIELSAILAPLATVGRSLTGTDVRGALRCLRDGLSVDCVVVGFGEPAVLALEKKVPSAARKR